MAIRNVSRRAVALLGLGVLVVYTIWMGWPYFHAIVVRDAAVTSWLGVTNAPIAGYTTNVLHPSDRAGAESARISYADMLRYRDRPGDREHARVLCDEAESMAATLGAVLLEQRARDVRNAL